MDQPKAEYMNAEFIGKTLQSKGEKKDGKPWKKYKLVFRVDDYERNFSSFDSVKGFDKLSEGETFNIGYVPEEYNHPEHGLVKSRKLIFVGEAKETGMPEQVPVQSSGKEDYWKSKEEDILIGQSINLAVLHIGFTKQEFTQKNILHYSDTFKTIISFVREQLKSGKKTEQKPDPKTEAEIKEVKDMITFVGGSATIDQLTHKFGEGTVAMLLELSDDFVVDGGMVKLK